MPTNARKLTELLAEREAWKQDVQGFFLSVRGSVGQSQSLFASNLGISQPYLSQIENGERTPSSETLSKLQIFMEGGSNATNQDSSSEAEEED